MAQILKEEVSSRKEAKNWEDLNPCPCCGGRAQVLILEKPLGKTKIACGLHGCRVIEGPSFGDAAYVWNQRDFRTGRPE